MKRTPKIVSKLLRTYFEICTSKFPVLDISEKLISTYDGDYPLFIVTYNVGEGNDYYILSDLIVDIENYTTLKHKRDYWLSLTFL
jgi:hypothetical protein